MRQDLLAWRRINSFEINTFLYLNIARCHVSFLFLIGCHYEGLLSPYMWQCVSLWTDRFNFSNLVVIFPFREVLESANTSPHADFLTIWSKKPTDQPALCPLAAGVAVSARASAEAKRCFGQTGGGKRARQHPWREVTVLLRPLNFPAVETDFSESSGLLGEKAHVWVSHSQQSRPESKQPDPPQHLAVKNYLHICSLPRK